MIKLRGLRILLGLGAGLLVSAIVVLATAGDGPAGPLGSSAAQDGRAAARSGAQGSVKSGEWRKLPKLPRPRGSHQGLVALPHGRDVLVTAGIARHSGLLGGLRYNAARSSWRALPRSPLCSRFGYSAALGGPSLFAWGGFCYSEAQQGIRARGAKGSQGASFDLRRRQWSLLPRAPLGRRVDSSTVWTGEQLLVWGGLRSTPLGLNTVGKRNGAAYDPRSQTWSKIPPAPLSQRQEASVVWTGEEMLVWSGKQVDRSGNSFNDGAAYSPQSGSWRPIAPAPIPTGLSPESEPAVAVWSGEAMLAWDGRKLAAYEPATDEWEQLPDSPLEARDGATAVWTGSELIIWGGLEEGCGDCFLDDGAAYDPALQRWRKLPRSPLRGRDRHVAAWTGESMVVAGGCCRGNHYGDAAEYIP